ncbi:TIM-barrel domain-containing protein [uncultured Clostridium sp.]|uniref:glycoside hydrolase family 31 protein n=1 Tax=uncultured Clostridium sp. TaxID=59620 RepID=UPI0028E6A74D|nr:TIM-barrel domain-containing protein [uncultured Clostridium sp.]
MNNKNEKLFQIFSKCFFNEVSEIENDICKMIEEPIENLSYQDICFTLFNLAEYIRITNNKSLLEKHRNQIEMYVSKVTSNWNLPQKNYFGQCEDKLHTSNVGMAYGSLYNINLFLKDEKTSQLVHNMKNFIYENNISGGMLSNIKDGKSVALDLLLAVVPFGLFAPEDLVLVESIKKIENTLVNENGVKYDENSGICPISTLLLSWYFAEKADYQKAKMYLTKVEINDELKKILKNIVMYKLKMAKPLEDTPIIHKPLGNENRYNSQGFERSPWNPKDGDNVIVNCVTWPSKVEEGVTLHYKVNGEEKEEINGQYSEEKGNYSFDMGSFKGDQDVEYYFAFGNKISKVYKFKTLRKEIISTINRIEIVEDKIIVNSKSNENSHYDLELKLDNNKFNLFIKETKNIRENSKKSSLKLDAYVIEEGTESLLVIKNGDNIFEIKDIYIWKKAEEVFSFGIVIASEEEEGFYGFGERYNNINQRGNIVDVYVYNQYKDQGIKTYFPMPYFLSSRNYGLYVHSNEYTEFNLAHDDLRYYSIESQRSSLELTYFIGNPREVIKQFVDLTGTPEMLPEWAFGPWMSSNNWDSDKEVRKQVELTKKYNIPSTALVIEAWSDESTYYIFNDAVYKENDGSQALKYKDFKFPKWGRWPDPKGLVEYLHDNELKCILWQIPIIKYMNGLHHLQKDNDENYMINNGYCVKNEDGTPYRMPEGWFTDSILFDYTSEEASNWWFDKRKYLIDDIGIDGFKTDGGEFVFGDNISFSNGKTGKEMRNLYPNLYIEKYYDFINKSNSGITFSRAGFTGAQKIPAHWAGDEKSTFDAFKRNLCAGLNAGLSGVSFWGWDLGGFSGEIPTAELFIRSTEMATFCPIMQYHAESKAEFNQDRTPWNIAERRNSPWVIDDYRYYAKLRMALIPYIMEQAEKFIEAGIPIMRAMLIQFPEDKNCWNIFDQYMFGDDLLVAPVVIKGAVSREVYLPEGTWTNIFTKEVFKGGRSYEVKASVNEIPVFTKEDAFWCFEIERENFNIYKKISKI